MNGFINTLRLLFNRRYSSKKAIKRYQLKKIKSLLASSIKHAPFYKESCSHMQINELADIKKLPIINKAIMMNNFDSVNTVGLSKAEVMAEALKKELEKDYLGYYQNKYVIGLSSGTSGNKGLFVTPKSLTKQLPFVFLARSGIPLRLLPYRILFMLRVFSQGFADINSPIISLKYLSTMTPIDEVVDKINKNNINILMAPPSLCRLLIPVANQIKKPLKMIVTYAEVLEAFEKKRLKEVFKTEVIEIYQASEGQFASACKYGNLHINEDLVYVELLDENYQEVTKPDVVAKHMIITNLINKTQPLIRYEMNDLIVLDQPCPCKSNFRTIKHILGRNDDVLHFYKKDGSLQHIFPDLISRWIMTSSENIREYKVIQHADLSLTIIIEPLVFKDLDQLEKDIVNRVLKECLTFDMILRLDIQFDTIQLPENRAKYKRFEVEEKIS